MEVHDGRIRPLGPERCQGGVDRIDLDDVVVTEAKEVGQRFPQMGFILEQQNRSRRVAHDRRIGGVKRGQYGRAGPSPACPSRACNLLT